MKRKGYRFLRTLFSPLIKLIWPTKFYGLENMVPLGERAIYTPNHFSATDIVPIAVKMFKKDLHVVMKDEAYKYAKRFFDIVGAIPIKRGESDMHAFKAIYRVLNADKQIVIFPEGIRNKKDCTELLPFKNGTVTFALKTRTPIVPMMIYRSPRPFRLNHILVGKPVYYDEYYDKKASDAAPELTRQLEEKINELRAEFGSPRQYSAKLKELKKQNLENQNS